MIGNVHAVLLITGALTALTTILILLYIAGIAFYTRDVISNFGKRINKRFGKLIGS